MVKDSPANAGDAREDGLDLWVRNIPWNRKRQSIPVFLPGKFYGQQSLAGHSPWVTRVTDDLANKPPLPPTPSNVTRIRI